MLLHADRYTDDEPSTSTWIRTNFVVGDPIGHGTFGKVYTVECRKRPGHLFAMKELMRFSHPRYIEMELKVLQEMGGRCNVMQMHAAHREKDRVFVIMDHFPHDSLRDILISMTTEEVLDYMRNMFVALQHLHKNGIIHRDIKPANFLYNRKHRRYSLIDFGLSQQYRPHSPKNKENNIISPGRRSGRAVKRLSLSNDQSEPSDKRFRGRCDCVEKAGVCVACDSKPQKNVNKAGTPGFRAPEILLKLEKQTPLIDVYAAGVTMLSLLCKKHPLFRPADDAEAIMQIACVLGSKDLCALAQEEGHHLIMKPVFPGVDIVKLIDVSRYSSLNYLDNYTNTASKCQFCTKLVYDNSTSRCVCRSSQEDSSEGLGNYDRTAIEVLKRCLAINPRDRYTAQMVLSIL